MPSPNTLYQLFPHRPAECNRNCGGILGIGANRAIGDDRFGPGVELDVGGETAAAGTDDARLSDLFCQIHVKLR